MTARADLQTALGLSQEYDNITAALSAISANSYVCYVAIGMAGNPASRLAIQVSPPAANLTTLLQNRQAALAVQLQALGVTVP